ncbi:hypothetical protein DV711_16375 [Motiliproteus coralliicola]|uniref:Arginine N-succinyltransferase n=1 Tax=Motiliproteus coralliicola TaxID=2283196 RepID=A0A369WAB4_9GAMM|nr:arginine N-succinyltransferase [Motiliproteus coralliicola]RDE18243.1 hypothetical protein DV711_16375 [Motiliproteus coralliicola]
MLIIRPCQHSDLADLLSLSRATGAGMTSMPADEAAWLAKIEASQRAFSLTTDSSKPASHSYFMVLEDPNSGRVVGTTAVYTGIGLEKPFYSYKLSTLVTRSRDLALTRKAQVLNLVNDYTGSTEVGSLFLLPEARQPGVGRFLSRGRFLLMADFPTRFGDRVMAELRGWQDEQGQSPLWQHLGSKFFGIEFQQAVEAVALKGPQFITDMMPRHPIHLELLPDSARAVIGKPHPSSAPAMNMLLKEGFEFDGYVDLFDGGPSIHAQISDVHGVRDSRTAAISISRRPLKAATEMMLSNGRLDQYRLVQAPARLLADGRLQLEATCAEALQLQPGDRVRFLESRQAQSQAQHAVA